jgi:Ca2+-binding EF-hand superfamily protein
MIHARVGNPNVVDQKLGTKYLKHTELGRQKIEQDSVRLATSQRLQHEEAYDHAVERGSYDLRTGLVTKCELEKRIASTRRARLMERNILMRNFKVAFVMSYIYPKRHKIGDAYAAIDMDGNGTLDEDEFDEGLREVLGLRLNKLEMALVFEVCDRDGDYTVEKYELDSMLHVCPQQMKVSFHDFRKSLYALGFTIDEGNCYDLWRHLDLEKGYKAVKLEDKLQKLSKKTRTSEEPNMDAMNDSNTNKSLKSHFALIKFSDLHAKLEPIRAEIVKFYILDDFSDQMQNEIRDAEDCAQGRWDILNVPPSQFRQLQNLQESNQQEIFRRLRNIYEKDVLPHEEEEDLLTRPVTPSTKQNAYQLLSDLMVNVAIEANDPGMLNKPTHSRKILTSTERSSTLFSVNYVKALMKSKLIRVRDIFREMDKDGSGSVDEKEFVEGMVKLGIKDVRPLEIRILYQALDNDGDKNLTLLEMEKALRGTTEYGTVNRTEFVQAMIILGVDHLMETATEASKDEKVRIEMSLQKLDMLFDQLTDGQASKRRVLFEAVVLAVRQLRSRALARGMDDGSGMSGLAKKAAQARAKAQQRSTKFREKEKQMRSKDATTTMLKQNNSKYMFGSNERGLLDEIKKTDNRDFIDHIPAWEQTRHGITGYHESGHEVKRIQPVSPASGNSKRSPLQAKRSLRKSFNEISKNAKEVVGRFGEEKTRHLLISLFLEYPQELEKVQNSDWDALRIMTDIQKHTCLTRFAMRLKRSGNNRSRVRTGRETAALMFMPENVDTRQKPVFQKNPCNGFKLQGSENISSLFGGSTSSNGKIDGDTKTGVDATLDISYRVMPSETGCIEDQGHVWEPSKVKATTFDEFNGIATWRLPPKVLPQPRHGILAKPQKLNGISATMPNQGCHKIISNKIDSSQSMDGALQKCKTLVGHSQGIKGGEKVYSSLILPGSDADRKRLRLASRKNQAVTKRSKSQF